MVYVKQTWLNNSPSTPLNATRLNKLETQYDEAKAYVDALISGIGSGGGGAVASVAGKTGIVTLTKSDVGLGSVDNTSDASKPVSTAQSAAITAVDNAAVHKTGAETIAGVKTFTSAPIIPDASLTIAKVSGLQTALNAAGTGGGTGSGGGTIITVDGQTLANLDIDRTPLTADDVNAMTYVGSRTSLVTSASIVRPNVIGPVYWMCANGVTPTNAVLGDIVFNASA